MDRLSSLKRTGEWLRTSRMPVLPGFPIPFDTIRLRLRWIITGCLLGGFLGGAIALLSAELVARNTLAALALNASYPAETQGRLVAAAFKDLNALSARTCSERHLAAMRTIAFRMPFIRDIAYLRNGRPICTSGLGSIVSSNARLPKVDFVNPSGRFLTRDFAIPAAPGIKSSVLNDGRYALLMTPVQYNVPDISKKVDMAVVLTNKRLGNYLYVKGHGAGLADKNIEGRASYFVNHKLVSVSCEHNAASCVVLSKSLRSIGLDNWVEIVLSISLGVALGGILANAAMSAAAKAASLPRGLRKAIKNDELFFVYQPIIDVNSGRISSAEALIRWRLPNGAMVSPDIFIPVAEELGLIGDITIKALRDVTHALREILLVRPDFSVSLNISSRDLEDPVFHAALREHVADKGISPHQIALELTERSSTEESTGVEATRRIAADGYKIYIDDFGTGYSNLSYLGSLAIHAIKIDKSFTDLVGSGSVRAKILPMILEMARELELTVIVEGVETEEQLEYFQSRGVYLMQGWLFSRPLLVGQLSRIIMDTNGFLNNFPGYLRV